MLVASSWLLAKRAASSGHTPRHSLGKTSSVSLRREYLVDMADRIDREKILDALDKADAAAVPPAQEVSDEQRR